MALLLALPAQFGELSGVGALAAAEEAEAERDRTRSNLDDVADELVRMKDANGMLTAERDALKDQLREAGEQNAAKDTRIGELDAEIEGLRSQLASEERRRAELERRTDLAEQRADRRDAQADQRAVIAADHDRDLTASRLRLAAIETRIRSLGFPALADLLETETTAGTVLTQVGALQTAPILIAVATSFLTMEAVKYLVARRRQARDAGGPGSVRLRRPTAGSTPAPGSAGVLGMSLRPDRSTGDDPRVRARRHHIRRTPCSG